MDNFQDSFANETQYHYKLKGYGYTLSEIKSNFPFQEISFVHTAEEKSRSVLNNSDEAFIIQNNLVEAAKQYIEGYSDELWDIYHLSNGGAFFGLDPNKTYNVTNMSGRTATLSGLAVGYFITQFVLSSLSRHVRFQPEHQALSALTESLFRNNSGLQHQFRESEILYTLLN